MGEIKIKGILAKDATTWKADFEEEVTEYGCGVMWKDQMSNLGEIKGLLRELISEQEYFDYYNIANHVSDYHGKIIDFATKEEYPAKVQEWEKKNPAWFKKSFDEYAAGNQKAVIAFLVEDFKKIPKEAQIHVNQFKFYDKIPSVKNAVAYIDILTKEKLNQQAMINEIKQLLNHNYNLILTGAPGTGKTYLAKQIAEQIVSQKKTLRPIEVLESAINKYEHNGSDEKNLLDSFKYRFPKEKLKEMTLDDYCIGKQNKDNFCYWIERKLKPLGSYFPGSSNTYLLYWNKELSDYKVTGYLKKLGQEPEALIKVLANDLHKMVNDNDPEPYSEKFGKSFILKVLNSYYPNEYVPINSKEHIDNIISLFGIDCNSNNIFERNKAIYNFYKEHCKDKDISPFDFMHILYENFNINDGEVIGEGGEIKTNGDYKLVQFHPSYDYTDFVEGLRPKRDDNGNVSFERKDGVFKALCSTALRNPNKKYVIIIDEINRGEISKIFGELFFSIDPGYRGKDGKVKTQYANMQEEPNDFDDALGIKESDNYGWFFVPENVYIIGTMNDIDRSVESMDFAFRRRFAFMEVTAKDSQKMLDSEDAWKDKDGNFNKPMQETIDKIKNRMDNLNAAIESIEGLSSAYHIGASYFMKLKNYRNDDGSYAFDKLWEYHLEGLLYEYLRGTTGLSHKMKGLATAYEYTKADKYE